MDIVGSPPGAAFVRSVTIPGLDEPFVFGVHPDFADHYGLDMGHYETRPTTNDMFVAAVGTCLAGVYAVALEARGVTVTGSSSTRTSWATSASPTRAAPRSCGPSTSSYGSGSPRSTSRSRTGSTASTTRAAC
jgi:hypothetical protein